MKEKILEKFLKGLDNIVFVKSTDSITNEVTIYTPEVVDMEAIIKIDMECDREDLKDLLTSLSA